jgi:hypothetical protein
MALLAPAAPPELPLLPKDEPPLVDDDGCPELPLDPPPTKLLSAPPGPALPAVEPLERPAPVEPLPPPLNSE